MYRKVCGTDGRRNRISFCTMKGPHGWAAIAVFAHTASGSPQGKDGLYCGRGVPGCTITVVARPKIARFSRVQGFGRRENGARTRGRVHSRVLHPGVGPGPPGCAGHGHGAGSRLDGHMEFVADGMGDWQQLPVSGAGGKHSIAVMAVLESLREAAVTSARC